VSYVVTIVESSRRRPAATAGACRRRPEVRLQVGRLKGLIYSADRGRRGRPRTYVHFMETPPLLTCDPGGRQLYIVGGRYRVTSRGIEG
jgi:hypothetical protein